MHEQSFKEVSILTNRKRENKSTFGLKFLSFIFTYFAKPIYCNTILPKHLSTRLLGTQARIPLLSRALGIASCRREGSRLLPTTSS